MELLNWILSEYGFQKSRFKSVPPLDIGNYRCTTNRPGEDYTEGSSPFLELPPCYYEDARHLMCMQMHLKNDVYHPRMIAFGGKIHGGGRSLNSINGITNRYPMTVFHFILI